MKKFGLIVDLTETGLEKMELVAEAFAVFSRELSPKHLKNTQLRIILPPGSAFHDSGRVKRGPLDQQEFGESPWQTDWLYYFPDFSMSKWLKFAAMAGPGPVLVKEPAAGMNPRITIPCLSDGEKSFTAAMSDCLDAIYHDDGARKIFSKSSRRIFSEELNKNKTLTADKVS